MNLRADWPLLAAGALGLVAFLSLRSSGSGSQGYGVYQDPNAAAELAASAQEQQQGMSNAAQLAADYLQLQGSGQELAAENYQAWLAGTDANYQAGVAAGVQNLQTNAELQAFKSAQPSSLQRALGAFSGLFGSLAQLAAQIKGFSFGAPSAAPSIAPILEVPHF